MASAIPNWLRVAAILIGAIVVGATLAVVVTALGRAVGVATPSPIPSTVAVATDEPATPEATVSPSTEPSATVVASPSLTAPSAAPSIDPTQMGLPEGCFSEGFAREPDPSVDLIIAEDLRDRLPLPSWMSEPTAVIGSSANGYFVSAYAECTGADPATIRFGGVSVGLIAGTIPQGLQIDGYSGPELARILIDGYLLPEERAELEVGHHGGWTYRYLDQRFAVTASPDTVYWYWVAPCCYEGPLFAERTFVEVINEYLDLTNDVPIDWS